MSSQDRYPSSRDKVVHIRRNIESYGDPYISELKPDEVAVCPECRSVYAGQRWQLESHAGEYKKNAKVREVLCPACRKIRDRVPGGVVTLSGRFLHDHMDEIVHLINHENRRAMEINPLERIMDIEQTNGQLVVLTTNEKLAQRIGRVVHKAYSGDLEYKWSEDDKLVRVNWHRD